MLATIIKSNSDNLLVKDLKTNEEVIVKFAPGNCVKIEFNGIMTRSIPPQITASSISEIECPG